jgi:Protoglobin
LTTNYSRVIQTHLVRLSIDETTLEHTEAAWTVIQARLPRMINEFYDHLFATGSGAYFENIDVSKLKLRQFEYWRSLFAGKFDEALRLHSEPIADKHRQAGVDLSQYIAAYAWFSERLFNLIARASPPAPTTKHDLFIAMNKLIYFDMILAAKGGEIAVLDL